MGSTGPQNAPIVAASQPPQSLWKPNPNPRHPHSQNGPAKLATKPDCSPATPSYQRPTAASAGAAASRVAEALEAVRNRPAFGSSASRGQSPAARAPRSASANRSRGISPATKAPTSPPSSAYPYNRSGASSPTPKPRPTLTTNTNFTVARSTTGSKRGASESSTESNPVSPHNNSRPHTSRPPRDNSRTRADQYSSSPFSSFGSSNSRNNSRERSATRSSSKNRKNNQQQQSRQQRPATKTLKSCATATPSAKSNIGGPLSPLSPLSAEVISPAVTEASVAYSTITSLGKNTQCRTLVSWPKINRTRVLMNLPASNQLHYSVISTLRQRS
ncbi:hypothetical protein BJ742DRAFT_391697 [Cladochytrium replicatum]|nr:hypothetical protein BJ742DRAFT_391697 [Cladochytrium replicatum]